MHPYLATETARLMFRDAQEIAKAFRSSAELPNCLSVSQAW